MRTSNWLKFVLMAMLVATSIGAVAQQPTHHWAIVLHGGAGVIERSALGPEGDTAYRAGLSRPLRRVRRFSIRAARRWMQLRLQSKSSKMIRCSMRDGRGVYSLKGKTRWTPSIMDGATLKAGAVAGVTRTTASYQRRASGDGEVAARDDRRTRGRMYLQRELDWSRRSRATSLPRAAGKRW